METNAEVYPFGPAESLVPHPRYAALRAEAGLCRVQMPWGGEAWLATRYDDVRTVLGDPRFSRALAAGREDTPRARPLIEDPHMILSMDPPDHTRLRRLVAKAFTARRVEELRPRVRAIVGALLGEMKAPADLAAGLAWPLPMIVISEMLGVDEADRADFRSWTEQTLALGTGEGALSREQIVAARGHLNRYLTGLVELRRAKPTGDLLSDLVAARDEGDRLSEDELVRLGVTLLIAGHETTANQIGNFVWVLLDNDRAGWRQLLDRPELVPTAVEELLRYVPMAASAEFARVAREDVQLGGQLVRAGEAVMAQMHAANRDRAVFPDPDTVDLAREHNPHTAFGHGVHHCLGAPLARLELQVALEGLLAEMPGLRLVGEVRWRADRLVRGVTALPVSW
ncbi:cytochrome P450 [Actinocrispum wychmicini]|nr:cytochrome P450 [Actinocrispum wychmicini]